jgi:hypothetical protein
LGQSLETRRRWVERVLPQPIPTCSWGAPLPARRARRVTRQQRQRTSPVQHPLRSSTPKIVIRPQRRCGRPSRCPNGRHYRASQRLVEQPRRLPSLGHRQSERHGATPAGRRARAARGQVSGGLPDTHRRPILSQRTSWAGGAEPSSLVQAGTASAALGLLTGAVTLARGIWAGWRSWVRSLTA